MYNLSSTVRQARDYKIAVNYNERYAKVTSARFTRFFKHFLSSTPASFPVHCVRCPQDMT